MTDHLFPFCISPVYSSSATVGQGNAMSSAFADESWLIIVGLSTSYARDYKDMTRSVIRNNDGAISNGNARLLQLLPYPMITIAIHRDDVDNDNYPAMVNHAIAEFPVVL